MSANERIQRFLYLITGYLAPIVEKDLEFLLERLGPYLLQDVSKTKRDYQYGLHGREETIDYLLKNIAASGTTAFQEFVRIITYEGRFSEIRDNFVRSLHMYNLESFLTRDKKLPANSTDAEKYSQTKQPSILTSFKKIIVGKSSVTEKSNFKQSCMKLFQDGFHFQFVMPNAIIDDLVCDKMPSEVALNEAKTAIHNLLPYALNLCRAPNRREYKIVKKYTAYYHAKIKNNLKCSSYMADSILESLGYKSTEHPDEATLDKPSKSILEIAFEIYMCELYLDMAISMAQKLTAEFNVTVNEVLIALLDESQRNSGKVKEQNIIRALKTPPDDRKTEGYTAKASSSSNVKITQRPFYKEESEEWMYDDDHDDYYDHFTPKTYRQHAEVSNARTSDGFNRTKSPKQSKDLKQSSDAVENPSYGSVVPMQGKLNGQASTSLNSKLMPKRDIKISEYGNMLPSTYTTQGSQSKAKTDKHPIIYQPPDDSSLQMVRSKITDAPLAKQRDKDSHLSEKNYGRISRLESLEDYAQIASVLSSIGDEISGGFHDASRRKVTDESIYENFPYKSRESRDLSSSKYSSLQDDTKSRERPAAYGSNSDSNYQLNRPEKDQIMGNEFAAKGMPAIYQRD